MNENPVRIKIFNADKVDVLIKYEYNESLGRYLPICEDMNLVIKFLGQPAPLETISEYSNYKK